VRGIYLTAANVAYLIGPALAGLVLIDNEQIGKVFALGLLLLLPALFVTIKYFRNYQDNTYQEYSTWSTLKYIFRHPDLRNILASNFLLYFFYSWMIVYAPIFLHNTIGFSLSETTTIISIAMLPFVLFQYYFGYLADKKFGEKELLITGFLIAGLSTLLMGIIDVKIFALWAGIIFFTRIGASMIESMIETYLFKKINDQNLDIIGLYRSTRSIVYIVSPLIASLVIIYSGLNALFIILGLIMIGGVYFSLKLKDTL
jgi:MFS family permease